MFSFPGIRYTLKGKAQACLFGGVTPGPGDKKTGLEFLSDLDNGQRMA